MRNDFIQNFSHEFKTPIVSIRGFTKRLLTKNLTEEQKTEYLNIILEESTRLATLATNTLYMSKLESIGYANDNNEFLLDEQIRQSVLLMQKQWMKKNLDVCVTVPKITYNGNEEMLKQVWLNLLSNAIKFSHDNGKINISAIKNATSISVSVADNGIGMSEETILRIFDKYYQADTSHSTEGNGLGLAIVKKILTLNGGDISLTSSIGNGSTFIVNLPVR
jgi:signal transduction histidine kinase